MKEINYELESSDSRLEAIRMLLHASEYLTVQYEAYPNRQRAKKWEEIADLLDSISLLRSLAENLEAEVFGVNEYRNYLYSRMER